MDPKEEYYQKTNPQTGKKLWVREITYPDGTVEAWVWDDASDSWGTQPAESWYAKESDQRQTNKPPTTRKINGQWYRWDPYQNDYVPWDKGGQEPNKGPALVQGNKTWDPNANEGKGAYVTAPGLEAPAETYRWTDPIDGSQWVRDAKTDEKLRQISPAIPGYRPLGVSAGPSPRQSRWPEEEEYDQLRNEKARRELAGTLEPSAWDKAATLYSRQKAEEKTSYDQQQDVEKAKRLEMQMEIDRRNAETERWQKAMSERRQAAGMALIPGQQYFLGYEPGGYANAIANMDKIPYNAESYRVPVIQYDEAELWKKAMRRA